MLRKIFKKIHHFTRTELAVEEIVIILIICLLCSAALAAKVFLPIRAGIVQCGTKADLTESCRRDARCCVLMENSGMSTAPAIEQMHNMDESQDNVPLTIIDEDKPITTME